MISVMDAIVDRRQERRGDLKLKPQTSAQAEPKALLLICLGCGVLHVDSEEPITERHNTVWADQPIPANLTDDIPTTPVGISFFQRLSFSTITAACQ